MDFELHEEQQLVELSKTDINAFGRLFELYYDKIFNYSLQRTGNVEVARDIAAETFFKALKNIHKFTWNQVSFSAWLYKIATNEIAAYFRKSVYRATSMEDLQSKGFEFVSSCNLEEEIIAAQKALQDNKDFVMCSNAIKELPIKYQDVITLRFFADKKISEIGVILGKSEGTIKSLLHRGLKKVKKKMLEKKNATFFQQPRCNKREG